MAIKQNSAEGGTVGATVTTGNSGGSSGDAFNQVTITGSISATFANNVSAHGSQSYRITGVSGDTGKFYLGNAGASSGAFRSYMYLNSLPSSAQSIFQIQSTTFTAIAQVNINAANRLFVQNAAGTTLFTTTATISATTWYRVELQVIQGSDTTDGLIYFQYFSGDSTTAIESYSNEATNAGTDNLLRLHMGKISSGTTLDANFDDIAYDTTATPIGPYSSNAVPIASAGLDKTSVEPYSTVTLNGSGSSDSDGSITTYTWTQTAGSPSVTLLGSGATRTFIAPGTLAGTTLTFGLTVTDNDGASSTQDTLTATILPVTERAVVGGVEVPAQIYSVSS